LEHEENYDHENTEYFWREMEKLMLEFKINFDGEEY
jgi:hypothetical protein